MKKLNYLGIGPKIGGIGIPYLALTIFLSLKYKPLFSISSNSQAFLFCFGLHEDTSKIYTPDNPNKFRINLNSHPVKM